MLLLDYRKLKGRIVEKCGTQTEFAKKMNTSSRTISLKLNSKIDFSQKEILKASSILEIDKSDIVPYFFTIKV